MNFDGYRVNGEELARYIVAKHFPERTDREDGVILDYIARHGHEYEEWVFAKRIGRGATPNPEHPITSQQATVFNSQKRIDMLARSGAHWTIIEVKYRVTPASLGQILTYRSLFLEENPDAEDPGLVVVGRYSDDDTLRTLQTHGVTVFLYPLEQPSGNAPEVGV